MVGGTDELERQVGGVDGAGEEERCEEGDPRPVLLPPAGEGGPTQSGRMRDVGDGGDAALSGAFPHPTPLRGATFSRMREKEGPSRLHQYAFLVLTSEIGVAASTYMSRKIDQFSM